MSYPHDIKSTTKLKLTRYYCSFFAVYGIVLPLWPRWLEGQISLEYVGLVLGFSYGLKLLVVPLTAQIAAFTGDRRKTLIALTLIVWLGLLLLGPAQGWIFFALIWGLAGAALSSCIPLADGLTMRAVQLFGVDFGKIRRWGSASFVVAALSVGALVDIYGLNAIYLAMLAMSSCLVLAAYFTPSLATQPAKDKQTMRFFKPLSLQHFPLFLMSISILWATHATLYGFSAIYWQSLGYSFKTISLLWVIGIMAEIAMFSFTGCLIKRFGAVTMIIVAGFGGILRWTIIAFASHIAWLVFAQTLHALTFALLLSALIEYINQQVPLNMTASAQGLYDSLSMGIFMGILTVAAGLLYKINPTYSFLLMTACSALGVILATILLTRIRQAAA